MRKVGRRSGAVVAAAFVAGCASANAGSTATTGPDLPGSAPATVAALPPDGLTGFGATDAEWDAHHTPDRKFGRQAVYDPDPTLATAAGRPGDRYTVVTHQGGRVVSYTMNLHPMTIGAAAAQARAEMPPDAHLRWTRTLAACVQSEFTSPTLARLLRDPSIGDPAGDMFVTFDTQMPGGVSGYNATQVNEALVQIGTFMTPTDAPDC